MVEHHIDIETRDGSMNTFVTYPEEGGPFPVVLFYMDAVGKREELHDMARRIGTVGYFVILSNLYYRRAREFSIVRGKDGFKDEDFKAAVGHRDSLTIEGVMSDTRAMLQYADSHPQASAQRVGTVGYCMSGPYVFAAAAEFPDKVACSASIYGADLLHDVPGAPHRRVSQIKGEVYFACAEIDKYAPAEDIRALDGILKAAGTNYRIEWYPGAHHGFAFPLRDGIYHKASSERHWERLFSLFRRNLQS